MSMTRRTVREGFAIRSGPLPLKETVANSRSALEAIAVDERHVCEIDRDRSPARPQRLQQFCKLGAIGHVDLTSDAYHRTVGGFIVVA